MQKPIRFILRLIENMLALLFLSTFFIQIKFDLIPLKIFVFSIILMIEAWFFQVKFRKKNITTFLFIYVISIDIITLIMIMFFTGNIIKIIYLISIMTLFPLILILLIRNANWINRKSEYHKI
ncbi:hypothetical protein D9V86_07420 [Bacteroidetes/Chlorobi group bacterium ChocPot_Mid]|jgi:hypothetical protein|nr:MAG: hypothetical protein D9V86_07420 [Bacteroidetes/Chlorobi group bacterium ChocPot_Mid]